MVHPGARQGSGEAALERAAIGTRVFLCALILVAVAGCTPGGAPTLAPTPEPAAGAVRLAAVGDSITDANSPNFAAGELGTESWVSYAVGTDVAFVGGWARWGATTADIAQGASAVEADVLVIMAGTNDAAMGSPFADSAANIVAIAQTAGADRVLISGIPPLDYAPEVAAQFNDHLESLAREHGWEWVDPGAAVRTDSLTFAPGMASDGVHPTVHGARRLGETLGAAIRNPD